MKRKVIQIADSTLLVSLPKKWADEQNIKKGDELDLVPEGSRIVVNTHSYPPIERTTLQLGSSEKFLRRLVDVLYRYGYDEVEVTFQDQKNLKLVQKCLDQLMGFEIVRQSNTSCTLKDITRPGEVDFDTILRRVFFMISEMSKNSYEAISGRKPELMGDIEQFDGTINKFTNFCERMLNKFGYKEHKKMTLIYYIVCQLEQLADEYKDMCTYLKGKKDYSPPKEVLNIYQQINYHFNDFTNLFYKFSSEGLFELKQQRIKIMTSIFRHLENNPKKEDAVVLYHLANIVGQIQHMATRVI